MKSKVFLLFLSLFAVFGVFAASNTAKADTVDITPTVSVTKTDGTAVTEGTNVQSGEVLLLNATFDIPNNVAHEGDTTVFSFGEGFQVANTSSFDVYDPNTGLKVATAYADKSNNTITLTYTDYVEQHSDIAGELNASLVLNTTIGSEPGFRTLSASVNNSTITSITVSANNQESPAVSPGTNSSTISKSSWLSDDGKTLHYTITVNSNKASLTNATVTDALTTNGGNLSYNKDLTVKTEDGTDVTANTSVNYTSDGSGFTLNLGSINSTYTIDYTVAVNYNPTSGETFDNSASFKADETSSNSTSNSFVFMGINGTASGRNFTLNLVKTDEAGNPLEGAEFTITRKSTNEVVNTVTTGADGKISVSGLLRDDYIITETKAPDGYELADPVTVNGADFDGQTLAQTVTVVDKENDKSTSSSSSSSSTSSTSSTSSKPKTASSTSTNSSNSKKSSKNELPSTGDSSTFWFTIAGLGLIAAGIYGVRRKAS